MAFGMKRKRTHAYNKSTGRNYKYDTAYESTPEQKRKRAQRNAARQEMMNKGLVHKGDGKDVDHRTPIERGGTNTSSNLRVLSKSENRGFDRTPHNKPK